ncbi:unnamed protein product, partial [Polarella glacialis]
TLGQASQPTMGASGNADKDDKGTGKAWFAINDISDDLEAAKRSTREKMPAFTTHRLKFYFLPPLVLLVFMILVCGIG